MISALTLREIDDLLKYFDNAEKELNSLEPISATQDVLTGQLRDHKIFHEELERQQRHLATIITKCKGMLREVCSEESDDVRSKLTNMSDQAEVICRLSSSRLQILEEKLPLATYFSMTFDRLLTWLADIELEITCIDYKHDDPVEEVKVKQDRAKAAQRLIDDYKAVVDDVIMTGNDLMSISTRYDAAGVQRQVDHVTNRYVIVKQSVRGKLALLDEAVRRLNVDVIVTLDSIVDDLQYLNGKAKYADPIAANPTTLRGQIAENESIVEDLHSCNHVITSVKGAIDQTLKKMSESSDEQSSEELVTELKTLDDLQSSVFTNTRQRSVKLRGAVGVADRFHVDFENTIDLLRDIRDELVAQELPGVETEVVEIQQKELKKLTNQFKKANSMLDSCRGTVEELANFCDAPGLAEVEKHLEDMESLREEIDDKIKDRSAHLEVALERSKFFNKYYKAIMQWLPKAEEKIIAVSPVAAHPRSVKIQIEELKVLKIQLRPHHVDIENLNQYMSDLSSNSPFMAEALTSRVAEINERWHRLLKEFESRETHLHDILVELGEVNHSVDDVIGFLQQVESDLQQFERSYVDPGHVILYLRKIQKELVNLDPVIARLNGVIQMSAERSGKTSTALLEKQDEMMNMYLDTQVLARDKLNELHGRLKQVKGYMGSVDDLLTWLHEFKVKLKATEFMGVLPEEVKTQHALITESYEELSNKEIEILAIMLNGEDMLARCREKDAKQLKAKLEMLQERLKETKIRAEKRKKKMEGHMKAVEMFHKLFSTHIDWLDKAEKTLATLKHRHKTMEKIQNQLQIHQELKKDVDFQCKIAQNVENTGTYLKYFGSKRDTVYVKNLLVGVKVRWKKLVRKVDEAGRLLQQAFREDKRFNDCWKSLTEWLDEGEIVLKKYVADCGGRKNLKEAGKEVPKEAKDGDELHKFQTQMSAKHPNYYSTMRLGTSLRDQCPVEDPEREVLNEMLEALKQKWNTLRSIASQRQVKLEEGLMSSGRLTDALQSLLEWLTKAEVYLVQDQPILGDLDTVSILIEKHKLFQQELTSRRAMVSAMLSSPSDDSQVQGQLKELGQVWERVKDLSEVRESKLQESLKLAETFNDAIQVVRDWLPDAEAELKFHSIPDDEDSIMQLIENHEKFQEELEAQQTNIDKIRSLAEEILASCHPNAVRFVKYYLTITQTRWEQAVSRSNQRSAKLHDALKTTRDNASTMAELMSWLNDGHALMLTKDKDDLPDDLTVVETLSKEHLEFHEELINKSKDIDRIVKSFSGGVSSSGTSPASGQSEKRTNSGRRGQLLKVSQSETSESMSCKATALQNKWKLVLKMSTDRKKKLQDALSRILELENCRNFDFEVWRRRYIAWNRANKLKFMDFFRRQDRHGTGLLTRKEFVEGIMASKFPTNETELLVVFKVFDGKRLGRIQYKTFVDAIMRPDKPITPNRSESKLTSDSQTIDQEIEDRLAKCQCRIPFTVQKVDDCKYKFGDKDRVCTVRLMNGMIYVRFGSSWMPLEEFINNNDPCKMKVRPSSSSRSGMGLSVHNTSTSGSTPRYRKVHSTLTNGRQSSASSSSSSSTSTWPRTEPNQLTPGSLTSSVASAPGGSVMSPRQPQQQSPTSSTTSPNSTSIRPSRRTPGSQSTPSSTASSPSSRYALKTFTTSRSPQRTPRARPSVVAAEGEGDGRRGVASSSDQRRRLVIGGPAATAASDVGGNVNKAATTATTSSNSGGGSNLNAGTNNTKSPSLFLTNRTLNI